MGHSSAKDQQLDDHYFGSIPPRVTSFMKELELECHKLHYTYRTFKLNTRGLKYKIHL